MNIFLSYCWDNTDIANQIDEKFNDNNTLLTRDTRDLKYKKSIKEFMNSIRDNDYVIMLITEDYLKSKNCMYEVLEFVKDKKFNDKIIPIIESDKIFNNYYKIEILKFWTKQKNKLKKSLKNTESEHSISISKEVKIISRIETEILDFLEAVCDFNNIVLGKNIFNNENFEKILNYIGLSKLDNIDVVLNLRLEEESLTTKSVLEYIESNFEKITVIDKKDNNLSIRFKSHLSIKYLEKKIYDFFDKKQFKSLNIFEYDEAYYFIAKKKVKEYNSKLIQWWSPLLTGYTPSIKDAGLYTERDIKNYDQDWFYEHHLAIKAKYVEQIDENIIKINSAESYKLIESRKNLIGDIKYENINYFF